MEKSTLTMQPSDFSQDIWGRLLREPGGYYAFIPKSLPPQIQSSWELTNKLSAADRAAELVVGSRRSRWAGVT